jgi:hypothetical protein
MTSTFSLPLWVVYDHPSDFPDCYVARRWVVGGGGVVPTDAVLTAPDLDQLRDSIQAHDPNANVPLPRQVGDDPKIVEIWV